MKKLFSIVMIACCTLAIMGCQPIGTSTCVDSKDLYDVYELEGTIEYIIIIKSKHERILSNTFIYDVTVVNEQDVEKVKAKFEKLISSGFSNDYFDTSITVSENNVTLKVIENENDTLDQWTYFEAEEYYIDQGYTCSFE